MSQTIKAKLIQKQNINGCSIQRGARGAQGEQGEAATIEIGTVTTGAAGTNASVVNSGTSSAAVLDFTIPRGDKGATGDTGNGISTIAKTGTSGLVDTYTITMSNGQTSTFTVTNGSSIASIALESTSGLVDTYRITLTNGNYFDFNVTNGRSIVSVSKTSTSGLVDTYTISYNDNTSSTFTVTNGYSPTATVSKSGDTSTITITDKNGTTTAQVVDGGVDADLSNLSSAGEERLHALKSYKDEGELLTDAEGLADIKKYAHSTFDKSKFTVTGSPIITDDGIASGFSSSNYVQTSAISKTANQTFEIDIEFNTSTLSTQDIITYDGNFFVYMTDSTMYFVGGGWTAGQFLTLTPQANSNYKIKWGWDGAQHYIKYSVNDVQQTDITASWTTGYALSSFFKIGHGVAANPFLGQIDLKQFSITVDGVEVFSGNKTGIDTIKPNDYTVVGTPTISADGVASGFSSSSYIGTDISISVDKSFLFEIAGHIDELPGDIIGGTYNSENDVVPIYFELGSTYYTQKLVLVVNNNGTNTNISFIFDVPVYEAGDDFKVEIYRNKEDNTYGANFYRNGLLIKEFTNNSSLDLVFESNIILGGFKTNYLRNSFNGSIDLNAFKIYVDGNLVYQPCLKIPYTESKTGSKIVQSVYRDRVSDMYEQFGYAPYYTLSDTDFTLPQGELYGLYEKYSAKTIDDSMPDYANAITISGSPYTAPDNGYILGIVSSTSPSYIGIDGINVMVSSVSNGGHSDSALIPIARGSVATFGNVGTKKFIPMKGVN